MSSTQQVVYRKGQPTATPILIYEDTRREVVQQCIANLMSILTVRLSLVHLPIGLRICCIGFITDKANRYMCKHWRAWSREKFVEHLRLLYPQLSNAADKSYLEMIREIPFQYDPKNSVLEL